MLNREFDFLKKSGRKLSMLALILGLYAAPNFSGSANLWAQQNPKALRTNAVMGMEEYKADRSKRADLKKSKEQIDVAASSPETNIDAKTWKYRGEIYMFIAADDKLKTEFPDASIVCAQSWLKAMDLEVEKVTAKGKPASKMGSKSEIRDGLQNAGNLLYNGGVDAYAAGGYAKAYPFFWAISELPTKAMAVFGDKPPVFQFKMDDANRMAGLAAMGAGKLDEGAAIIKTLLEKDKISAELQPGVYATVAEAFMDAKKSAQANEWVNAGRKKFPNDQNLLYTAINFAIAENRLAALEAELKQAIDANPTNVELMFIMGNLYDGMFRERVRPNEKSAELNAEDEKLGFESFGKAAGWYERGMKTNPKHFNSVYSLGVLHANHANFCYKKLDALQTKDPTYKIFQQASEEAITKSLNLLLEAEKLEPANTSALDALKSIYGQQNNVAKYEEYKKKSEEARKGK